METCEGNNIVVKSSPETKKLTKGRFFSRMLPNAQECRKNSFTEESFCFRATCLIKKYHNVIMSSNFPTYFCIFIYILICLIGNIVTGVIWFQHNNRPTEVQEKGQMRFDDLNNFTIHGFNGTLLQSNLDEEFYEHEISSLFDLIQNSTANKVSIKTI